MSMPTIPDIKPRIDIDKKDVINLVLASVALEEIGLSHILNAEGEKLQAVIAKKPCVEDLLKANKSVERTIRAIIKKEMLLEFKMDDVLDYYFNDCDDRKDKDCKDHKDREKCD